MALKKNRRTQKNKSNRRKQQSKRGGKRIGKNTKKNVRNKRQSRRRRMRGGAAAAEAGAATNNDLFILDTDIGFDPDDTLALAYLLKFLSTKQDDFGNVILISSAEPPETNARGLPPYSRAALLVQAVLAISEDLFNEETEIFERGLTIYQGSSTKILDRLHFVTDKQDTWKVDQYKNDGQVVVKSLEAYYSYDVNDVKYKYIENFSDDSRVSIDILLARVLQRINASNRCTYCSIGAKTNLAYLLPQTNKINQIVSMSMALPRPGKWVNTNVRLDPEAEEVVMNWVAKNNQCLYIVIPSYLLDDSCKWYQRGTPDKNIITYGIPEIESFLESMSNIKMFIEKHLEVTDWLDVTSNKVFWTYNNSKVNDPITVMVALSEFFRDRALSPVDLRKVLSVSYNNKLDEAQPSAYMILENIMFDPSEEEVSNTIENRVIGSNTTASQSTQGIEFSELNYNQNKFYMADELIEDTKAKWLSLFESLNS